MDKSVILELKTIPIFGELLDYNYYIGKDFSLLLKKIKEIKSKKKVITKYEKDSNLNYLTKLKNI